MKNHTQSKTLRRNTRVRILVKNSIPYSILDRDSKEVIGTTHELGEGVYLHSVNFKVIDGQPTIEGRYKGRLEELRMNLSDGIGVMFDNNKQAFTDGNNVIRSARMVQVYNGIIKVVLK